jgi:hypothetical protein
MKSNTASDALLPPGLLSEILAAAEEEHREPRELVGEAVSRYLEGRRAQRAAFTATHTPAQAAARIRELRKGNILPPDVTIKDLISHGRA